jgi:hypothetical protein
MRKFFVLLGPMVILAGCASGPATNASGESLTAADFGPFPTEHSTVLSAHLNATLKDPMSAQIRHYAGPATYAKAASLLAGPVYGWGTCYTVNAKNSFGAYTGTKVYLTIIRNRELIDVMTSGGDIYTDANISRFCNSAGAANAGRPSPPPATALTHTRHPAEGVTQANLSMLKPGLTTRADAVRLFGQPVSVSAMYKGTLLQWMSPSYRAHVAVLFADDAAETMVRVTHSFFQ